jgi:hypothetical protein
MIFKLKIGNKSFYKFVGLYFTWFIIHFGILLIFSSGIFIHYNYGADDFWPFVEDIKLNDLEEYDITEFVIYTIFPLAIIIIYYMIAPIKKYIKSN